ncbi:MAG: tRNA lysidine(34) synthetase TilS [Selenomonadaceae bacterium]|nr:tRNA lysidine(34) synthetase TilS [Selenomonadaceae bacterium]
MASHKLVTLAESKLKELGLLAEERPLPGLLAACSGGADSLALTEICCLLKEKWHFRLGVAHYEHGIRGEASLEDAAFVAAYAKGRALPCFIEHGDAPTYAKEQGLSLETAARELRYAFLRQICLEEDYQYILVAHHADDQAETLLMRLLRGTGPWGLAGMRLQNGNILRPLLTVPKEQLIAFCAERGLSPRIDATNFLPQGTRNKLRREILPLLTENYNPKLTEALNRLAEAMEQTRDYLDKTSKQIWPKYTRRDRHGRLELSTQITEEHPVMQHLLLRMLFHESAVNENLHWEHYQEILDLLQRAVKEGATVGQLSLPLNRRAELAYGWLSIVGTEDKPEAFCLKLGVPGICRHLEGGWTIRAKVIDSREKPAGDEPHKFYCAYASSMEQGLTVRSRLPGDTLKRKIGTKKLKDCLIDAKVPRGERDAIPLVVWEEKILWAAGYLRSGQLPPEGASKLLLLEMEMDSRADNAKKRLT